MTRWTTILLALAQSASTVAQAPPAACNGHSELCNRQYSNITFVGSHDSAFVGTGPADNQETSVAAQLAQGVRFLQAQTHPSSSSGVDGVKVLHLCHTLCALEDAGPLADYLGVVKTFLDANPAEVVTLLLTNQEGQPADAFDAVLESSGVKGYVFAPPENLTLDQWPTLGEMISMGQRLVVFMDFPAGQPVPQILDEFKSFIFETPFDATDPAFPQCSIDRPSGASPAGRMILVNHFLDLNLSGILIPDRASANVTNSMSSIMAQANLCSGIYGRNPNFILLDWMSIGDGMAVQASMNGVQYIPPPPPPPAATPTSARPGGQPAPSEVTGSNTTARETSTFQGQTSGARARSRLELMSTRAGVFVAFAFAIIMLAY